MGYPALLAMTRKMCFTRNPAPSLAAHDWIQRASEVAGGN